MTTTTTAFDIDMEQKISKTPLIASRLSDKGKTDIDPEAVAEKHRKAEERYKTNLTPAQVVEHNRRVEVVGAGVQIDDMEKRRQLEQQMKDKQERANQKRQEIIGNTKGKAAKVGDKVEAASFHAATIVEKKKEELKEKITAEQISAAEKRCNNLKEVQRKADVAKKLQDANQKRRAAEEEAVKTLSAEHQISQEEAARRRSEKVQDIKTKAAASSQKVKEAQWRSHSEHEEKLYTSWTDMEIKQTSAEERREEELAKRTKKASAVVQKHEEKVAQQKASEQKAAETAAKALQKKLSKAERRAEDALSAKTAGLTEYIKTLGVSPPMSTDSADIAENTSLETSTKESPNEDPINTEPACTESSSKEASATEETAT